MYVQFMFIHLSIYLKLWFSHESESHRWLSLFQCVVQKEVCEPLL